MQKHVHNHGSLEGCDANDCPVDRYEDGTHEFTDRTIEAEAPTFIAVTNGHRDGTVGELIDRRRQVYGEPTETFPRIAQVWSGISGHEISALDVPLMLIGLKAVRTQVAPDYSDNSDDIEGFLDIFRELVGEDMVKARLVSEYIEKKFGDG